MMHEFPFLTPFFLSAYVTINLGLMNLILTVIVDKASEARADDVETNRLEKQARQQRAREALERVCDSMDGDNSGELTQQEVFEGYATNEAFRMTLDLMDVKEEDLKTVWNIMDSDRSGTVSCSEFVDQVHKMKTQESHTMLVFIKHYINEIRANVCEELDIVKNTLLKEMMREQKAVIKDMEMMEAELSPSPVLLQPKFVQPQSSMDKLKTPPSVDAFSSFEQDWGRSEAHRKSPAAPLVPGPSPPGSLGAGAQNPSDRYTRSQPLPEKFETGQGLAEVSGAVRVNTNLSCGSSGLSDRAEPGQSTCSKPSQTEFSSLELPAQTVKSNPDVAGI